MAYLPQSASFVAQRAFAASLSHFPRRCASRSPMLRLEDCQSGRRRPPCRRGRGRRAAEAEMSEFDYDLFVIGGGSGGVRAARIAAGHGAKVADRRGIPLRRHLRDPRLRAEEAAGLRQPLPRRVRGCGGLRLERRGGHLRLADLDCQQGCRDRPPRRPLPLGPGTRRCRRHAGPRRACRRAHGGCATRQPQDHGPHYSRCHRRAPRGSRYARCRPCHHLQRGVPSGKPAEIDPDRRRRLHRRRVRLHLQRPRRRHHASLSRPQDPARLRRGAARYPHQGAVQARDRRAMQCRDRGHREGSVALQV